MISRRQAVQASLLAAFLPAFFASGRAWASPAREAALFEAHRRAVERGRPLLVFVVPTAQDEWFTRGEVLGALLNHGGDEALAAFALCEIACGDEAAVGALAGQPVPGGAWYALLETDRVPAQARFAQAPSPSMRAKGFDEGWMQQQDAALDASLRLHRDTLVRLVMPDRATVARYAAQAEAVDPAGAAAVLRAMPNPDAALVGRAPAVLALAAADGRTDRAAATATLAEVGRAAWVERVLPGSRWALAGGCGVEIEGDDDDQLRPACGMGYVSEKARRMLYFYEPE